MYDPATGQRIQKDPLGVDSDPLGNLYAYVANNPINNIDPSGQQPPRSHFDDDLIVNVSRQPTLLEFVADSLLQLSLEVGDPKDFCPVDEKPRDTLILDFVAGPVAQGPSPSPFERPPAIEDTVFSDPFSTIKIPSPPTARKSWKVEEWCNCLEAGILAKPKDFYQTAVGVKAIYDLLTAEEEIRAQALRGLFQQFHEFIARVAKWDVDSLDGLSFILPDTAKFFREENGGRDPAKYCHLFALMVLELTFVTITLGTGAFLHGTLASIRTLAGIGRVIGKVLAASVDLETWGKILRRLRRVNLGDAPQIIKNVKRVKGTTVEVVKDAQGRAQAWVVTSDKNGRTFLVVKDGSICGWRSPGECFNLLQDAPDLLDEIQLKEIKEIFGEIGKDFDIEDLLDLPAFLVPISRITFDYVKGARGIKVVDDALPVIRQATAEQASRLRQLAEAARRCPDPKSIERTIPDFGRLSPNVQRFLKTSPLNKNAYRRFFGSAVQDLTEEALTQSGAARQFGLIFKKKGPKGIPDIQIQLGNRRIAVLDWTTIGEARTKLKQLDHKLVLVLVEIYQPGPGT